ncbi:NlpC/P60 family protein [Streptomyces harbinensis]
MEDARVDNAIAWAEHHLGSTAYATRCLAFAEDAYERANHLELFGGDTAHESATAYEAATRDGVPPRGAFVFFDSVGELFGTRRNWGHVGIALGEGRIIHAWDRVRVDTAAAIEALTPPPAGTAPGRPAGPRSNECCAAPAPGAGTPARRRRTPPATTRRRASAAGERYPARREPAGRPAPGHAVRHRMPRHRTVSPSPVTGPCPRRPATPPAAPAAASRSRTAA